MPEELENKEEAKSVKPGWKTSEFWVMVAGSIVGILNGAFGWAIPTETVLGVAAAIASYILGRSIVKK